MPAKDNNPASGQKASGSIESRQVPVEEYNKRLRARFESAGFDLEDIDNWEPIESTDRFVVDDVDVGSLSGVAEGRHGSVQVGADDLTEQYVSVGYSGDGVWVNPAGEGEPGAGLHVGSFVELSADSAMQLATAIAAAATEQRERPTADD